MGEGNGTPLQYSCPENPRDGGAWWAAVCGVAQGRTRLKRLSSSSGSLYGAKSDKVLMVQAHRALEIKKKNSGQLGILFGSLKVAPDISAERWWYVM